MIPTSLSRLWPAPSTSLPARFALLVLLSWIYAACSQVMIPLPFNLVPLSLQPLPLLLAAHWFGSAAIYSYLLYLAQGAYGLPFFARGGSGLAHLCGPTGGYLWGFLVAMTLVTLGRTRAHTRLRSALLLAAASTCYFICGLVQLSLFIPSGLVLTKGLLPFLPWDFFKLAVCWLTWQKTSSRNAS